MHTSARPMGGAGRPVAEAVGLGTSTEMFQSEDLVRVRVRVREGRVEGILGGDH